MDFAQRTIDKIFVIIATGDRTPSHEYTIPQILSQYLNLNIMTCVKVAEDIEVGAYQTLPYTSKVLAEQLV